MKGDNLTASEISQKVKQQNEPDKPHKETETDFVLSERETRLSRVEEVEEKESHGDKSDDADAANEHD